MTITDWIFDPIRSGKVAIFDGPIDIQKEIVISGNYQITENNVPVRIDTGLQVEEEEDEP